MQQFNGRRAVITGAASGIGRALAIELAQSGCHCCLIDREALPLSQAVEELRSMGVEALELECDVSDFVALDAALDRLLATWSDVDILVNNAGVTYRGRTHEMSAQEWQRVLSVNLLAPMRITQRLLPRLLARPDAHIVNMCSLLGLCGFAKFSAYCASKFGLVGYTEALRAEYRRGPLKVHAICPGFVRTSLIESVPGPGGTRRRRSTPAWLCTTPETVARATLHAMRRNRGVVVLTPLAQLSWRVKRYCPGLLSLPALWQRSPTTKIEADQGPRKA